MSGERFEATQIEGGGAVLVIGVEYVYDEGQQFDDDYVAHADGLAATVKLSANTKAQWILFGVSWVTHATEENKINPWLVGDPAGARSKMPRGPAKRPVKNPYGDVPEGFFTQIECPWERKDDLLALFDGLRVVQHTNVDEGYDYLADEETAIDVENPSGGEGIWMEVGSEYTLGIGGWHAHYDPYEADYRQLKEAVRAILAGRRRFIVAYVGEGERSWRGSGVFDDGLPDAADGWTVLRSMKLPAEHMAEFARRGGTVEIVSWLPERCKTLCVESRG